ncbi:uncharacterized protein LOC108197343 [Daucus carota subsp. sativus]|uniref:Uncharacterized protein n=1 Tax=Daucus carota subsp. sativus TaxID=79200 RepID=A0A166FMH6_DAUCS|nr:PREDICTED: uncharacterized protein LOC108197343 [Daucus carota subsp. sativus]
MSGDGNFQQIWNFRSKDDDIDSSSDDSKSSKGEAKRDLASALIFVGNDDNSDDPGNEKIDQVQPGEGVQSKKPRPKKQPTTKAKEKKSKTETETKADTTKAKAQTTKARGKKSKTERKTEKVSRKGISKRKKKISALNSALLNEFKIFTETIIQDLRVQREQMFAQMKEEMQKLVSVELNTVKTTKPKSRKIAGQVRHVKSTESDMRPWNSSDGTLGRSIVSSWIPDSNNYSNVLDERVTYDHQAVQNLSSNKKEKGEPMGLLAKQPMYTCNQSDQFVASSYVTLPSPPSGKLLEHQNTDSPFRNGNTTALACDRRNMMINAMNHSGYISGAQVEVPFPGFTQMGTKYVRFNDQHCTQNSSTRNGFQLPFHQRLENTFNIPSQLENYSGGNNLLGWRMNGGTMGFSANAQTLSDNIAVNNVRNGMPCKANEEVNRFSIQDLRDGNFN